MNETTLRCPRCESTKVTRHMTPAVDNMNHPWTPVRDEAYRCAACGLMEECLNEADSYETFRNRWNDPIVGVSTAEHLAFIEARGREADEAARAWTWPTEWPPDSGSRVTNGDIRAAKLAEERTFSEYIRWATKDRGETLPEHKYGFPVGEQFVSNVLLNPDDDAPRWAYAQWLRGHDTRAAQKSADFVEWQLRLAESLRGDPRADIKPTLPNGVFDREEGPNDIPDQPWWRYPGASCGIASDCGLGESTLVLAKEGLIDRTMYFRGFVEHVAIKAQRFLEIADELYSLAPIRHLTITYCKGLDHKDEGLWKALLESPHLDRIRSLKLPVRIFGIDNEYTELNRLTDADIEMLAASTRLRGLRYLNLDDESYLTVRAFDALAASPNLPELSFVSHDIFRYSTMFPNTAWGNLGKPTRELASRPLAREVARLEARHGRLVWLHPRAYYGTDTPDVEAVVEYPVAVIKPTPMPESGDDGAPSEQPPSSTPGRAGRQYRTLEEDQARLDAGIELYRQALATRDAGDYAAAMTLIERALGELEGIDNDEVAKRRVRMAITHADFATYVRPDLAVHLAILTVVRARELGDNLVLSTALYVEGKAHRYSANLDYGVHSYTESFLLSREIEGDAGEGTTDSAAGAGLSHLKLAQWARAVEYLDHAIEPSPDRAIKGWYLNRAIAHERLGSLTKAYADLATYRTTSPHDWREDLNCHVFAARLHASAGRVADSRTALAAANRVAKANLEVKDARWGPVLESVAWLLAHSEPKELLASEVAIRGAMELARTPAILDTARRIGSSWRPDEQGRLGAPYFASLEVDTRLMAWNPETLSHENTETTQSGSLLVVGPKPAIDRFLKDPVWRRTCVERLFSWFSAERHAGTDPLDFLAPVRDSTRALDAKKILAALREGKAPPWSSVRTFAINWQGEPTPMSHERFAALAIWNRRLEGKLEDEHEAWKIMRSVGGSAGLEDTRTLVGESADTMLSPGPMPGLQQRRSERGQG